MADNNQAFGRFNGKIIALKNCFICGESEGFSLKLMHHTRKIKFAINLRKCLFFVASEKGVIEFFRAQNDACGQPRHDGKHSHHSHGFASIFARFFAFH